jgi:hypothetical protein
MCKADSDSGEVAELSLNTPKKKPVNEIAEDLKKKIDHKDHGKKYKKQAKIQKAHIKKLKKLI